MGKVIVGDLLLFLILAGAVAVVWALLLFGKHRARRKKKGVRK